MPDPHTNIVLDGGATRSLHPGGPTCASGRLDPATTEAATVATHERFVTAGAQLLTTDTMHVWPKVGGSWAQQVDRAVALARRGAKGVQVWGALPPASMPGAAWADADFEVRGRMTSGWGLLAARFVAAGVDGLVLQSFADPVEAAAAIAEVRAVTAVLPIAACLSPRHDGRLQDGSDPAPALRALRQAGASWVGFNCGTGPASIEAAVALAPDADWARPSSGGLGTDALAASLIRLGERCHFVGGCCGVGPEVIAVLALANRLVVRHPGDAAAVSRRLRTSPPVSEPS